MVRRIGTLSTGALEGLKARHSSGNPLDHTQRSRKGNRCGRLNLEKLISPKPRPTPQTTKWERMTAIKVVTKL